MEQSTSESTMTEAATTFTPCAALAAIGCHIQHLGLFEPIRSQVQIAQKTVQTAINLASSLIRREVKPQEHEAIIGDAIGQFSKLN